MLLAHTHTHAHTHAHTRAHTHAHTHMHMCGRGIMWSGGRRGRRTLHVRRPLNVAPFPIRPLFPPRSLWKCKAGREKFIPRNRSRGKCHTCHCTTVGLLMPKKSNIISFFRFCGRQKKPLLLLRSHLADEKQNVSRVIKRMWPPRENGQVCVTWPKIFRRQSREASFFGRPGLPACVCISHLPA